MLGAVPADVATVVVDGPHGRYRYLALSAGGLRWLCEHAGAVEFHGWGCTAENPERAAFARILLEHDAPPAGDGVRGTPRQRDASKDAETLGALSDGALLLRAQLRELGLQAIPLLSGTNGIALWVPLSDGPPYVALRGWLHTVSNEAVRRYPQRFSTEPNTHASGRIHLHVGTNAPGRYSALPYSLRGDDELRVCTPVTWTRFAATRSARVQRRQHRRTARYAGRRLRAATARNRRAARSCACVDERGGGARQADRTARSHLAGCPRHPSRRSRTRCQDDSG